ncbi:MFS transporter, partial [Streptomyces sp. NPDC059802]|uniref:MFS transporter n=1 Tax=Streptomyces sp. NPDC059802 TaxID=3346952 RepID=UPI0036473968
LLATGAVAASVVAGHVWIWLLMAAAFVQGSLSIFYRLAERAGVRHLVPAAQLPKAMSANEARTQAAGLLGQPGGSVLYAVARSAPFALATAAHAVSLFSLLLIRKNFQDERPQQPGNITAELREGLSWTWGQRFLRFGMLLLSGSNLLFQVLSLALILILKDHGSSAALVGVITAVSGLGGMLGALTGSWWIRRFGLRALLIGGSIGWALLMPLVGLTGNPLLLGLIFLGAAMIGSVTNVAGGIYQVTVTPDRLQGRAGAAMGLIATGASSLGTFAGGFALEHFGTGTTVFGAASVMGLIALSSFLLPAAALPEQAGPSAQPSPHPTMTDTQPEEPEGRKKGTT